MPARLRKLIGGVGIVAFVCLYAVIASMIFERLPHQALIQLFYMAVVGTAWGLPIIPFINWMNRGSQ